MQADLSAAERVANVELTENLLRFVYDDRGGEKVPSGVTDPSEGETFSTVFFRRPSL